MTKYIALSLRLCALFARLLAPCLLVVATGLSAAEPAPPAAKPAQIEEMLVDMGFEPVRLPSADGRPQFGITVVRNRRPLEIVATLSEDGTMLDLSLPLNPGTNHANASLAVYRKLLEHNNYRAGQHFALDAAGGLQLINSHDARRLTHAGFRKAVDALVDTAFSTEADWNAPNFASAPAAELTGIGMRGQM